MNFFKRFFDNLEDWRYRQVCFLGDIFDVFCAMFAGAVRIIWICFSWIIILLIYCLLLGAMGGLAGGLYFGVKYVVTPKPVPIVLPEKP